jgi:ketosteroid isomerase-like protein
MSQRNVDLVLGLMPAPDVDLVESFRDDGAWAAFGEALSAHCHPDFESANSLIGIERTYVGMEGFRALWLDWLSALATQRVEVERAIDLGERVLVIGRAFGTIRGSTAEVSLTTGAILSVRDGKVSRIEFYPDSGEALEAVGLER